MAARSVVRERAEREGLDVGEYVKRLIEKHGSVADAAISIGIRPASLYLWINRLGLEVISSTQVVRSATVVARDAS